MTDCRPVSLISVQSVRELSREVGIELDKRRFRANIYVDLAEDAGFAENTWVGRKLRIGAKAEIVVIDRDPRCKMITLDPETGNSNPAVMRCVAQEHRGTAGIYAAMLVEGVIRTGDSLALLDEPTTRSGG